MNNIWINKAAFKLWEDFEREREIGWARFMIYGILPVVEPKEDDGIQLAYVDGHKMIGVHKDTLFGYELRDDIPMVKLPLVPTPYTTFERWARLMDV